MESHETLLTFLFEAYNRKDIAAAGAVLHPDVEWWNLLSDEPLQGADAVRQMWERQFLQFDAHVSTVSLAPEGDDGIRMEAYYVVRGLDGRLFTEETGTHLFRFRDGLIISMDTL